MYKQTALIGSPFIFQYNNIEEQLKNYLEEEIKNGCSHFLVGNLYDFDNKVFEIFRKLKKDYPQIQITQVVNEYNAYNYKVKNYSRVYETNYLFLELEEIDMTGNLLELHKFMVDNSDKIISCYNTANDIPFMEIFNYAISNQKEIINFFEFI